SSPVCSPKRGERGTAEGEADILMGLPTDKYVPRFGCSTSTTVPVARSDWSSASSFIDRIGPQGMSSLLRISIASNLVLVIVHCSMRANISFSRGRRAAGLALFASVFQVGAPVPEQDFSQ